MKNEDFCIVENKALAIVAAILTASFGGILTAWAIAMPRDGQKIVVYIAGLIIWSFAVLLGTLSILETLFSRFGVSNGVLYRTNGIMKMKRIPLEDIAKVVIIDRTAPHENRSNPIAYKVKIMGKEGKTLLSFYDPSGKYAFDDTFHYVLNNHRIPIEIKRIFGSSSPHDAQ